VLETIPALTVPTFPVAGGSFAALIPIQNTGAFGGMQSPRGATLCKGFVGACTLSHAWLSAVRFQREKADRESPTVRHIQH
jgi:hypothetical protein